ncbi:MAG: cache domain-containing protein [Lachnospiraceae bacterium]|nr:cache domain-containing protein [Lachnospiraceae bacterium]
MKLNISKKIILIAATGVVFSSVIILVLGIILTNNLYNRIIYNDMSAMQALTERIQRQEEERLVQLAQMLTVMPELVEALHKNEVEELKNYLELAGEQLGLDLINITDTNGIVIARGHFNMAGDDISARPMTRAALDGETVGGIFYDQSAVVPFAIRANAPVYRDGELIGVLGVGINIATETYIDNIYMITGIHFSVFYGNTRYMTSIRDIDGQRILGSRMEESEVVDAVLEKGDTVINQVNIVGEPCIAAYWPITDFEGNILGMWALVRPMTAFNLGIDNLFMTIVLSAFGIVGLIIFAAALIGKRIANPIRIVTDYAVEVAKGNLDTTLLVDVRSEDEIELLVGALKSMVASLKERIQENELQLTKLNLVVKAMRIGLWNMEVNQDDPVHPENVFVWSDDFRQMVGYESKEDFPDILSSWTDRIVPEEREKVRIAFEKHITDKSGNTPYDVEYMMIKKNGESAYFRDTGETIRDKDGNPIRVAGAIFDITETTNLINEVKSQRAEAEAANRAKSSFLSTMSHEIRTPMNAILGITEIHLMKEEMEAEVRAGLEGIYSSGYMLLGIINNILDLSKIEAGKLELIIDKYEIVSLVSDTAQLNMMRIGSKPIEFEVNVDEDMPQFLLGDELRVKQILNNILSNAFKYTAAGSVKLRISAEDGENDEVILVMNVSDSGQGMSDEQKELIFNDYARFNVEINRDTEGTGLGMSITNNLVQMMNGSIAVESECGVGSVFTVKLPQGRSGIETIGADIAENLRLFRTSSKLHMRRIPLTFEPMPYGSILIVDDVDTNIYVARGLMLPYGMKIDSAGSGQSAIDIIASGKVYDIIFMDHMMPVMDGIEATGHIRKMGYQGSIVALTANAVAGQANIFLESGFDDFISKPIDMRHMNSILMKLVRDKQPPEVIEATRRQRLDMRKDGIDVGNPAWKLLGEKEIAGLDISSGLLRYHGNVEAYLELLHFYTTEVRALLVVNESISEEKLNDYRIKVHGIKGTSFEICANPTGQYAAELEDAARSGDLSFINAYNTQFVVDTTMLIDSIDEMLTEIRTLSAEDDERRQQEKPRKERPDPELLAKLLAACEIYDMGAADKAMKEIEMYHYQADEGLMEWLRENVSIMNFEEICERLAAK